MLYGSWKELSIAIDNIDGCLYIAGAGNLGRIYGEYFNWKNIQWEGFLDKYITDRKIFNKRVYSYEEILGREDCYVLISSTTYSDEIKKELLDLGIKEDKIFYPEKYDVQIVFDMMGEMYHINTLVSEMKKFNNIHEGDRCFIIGNGPSLDVRDLERLKDEITFASNSIYALYEYTNWRPSYYGAIDPIQIKMFQSNGLLKKICECNAVFTGLISLVYLKNRKDEFDNIFFFKNKNGLDFGARKTLFSSNIDEVIYTSGTITYILIQLAVYMGLKEIYLLGVDFSFSNEQGDDGKIVCRDVMNHNEIIEREDEKYYPVIKELVGVNYLANTDYQIWGYRAAKKYADAHGIKIYNATRGGRLEVFERTCFDDLFCKIHN